MQIEFRTLQSMWTTVALVHLLNLVLGLPKCIQFIRLFVDSNGNDKILMKIPEHIILIIEFEFNPEIGLVYAVPVHCT